MRSLIAAALALGLAAPAPGGEIATSVGPGEVTDREATPLGLYLTARDAHAALIEDGSILFVDMRDPIEVNFVGHAAGIDANAPFAFASHRLAGSAYAMRDNPGFVSEVDALLSREGLDRADPVFLICRSGGRSAVAARALIAAGYTQVWNVIDGFEGGRDPQTGHRTVDGWRNSGLPRGYRLDPRSAWTPDG